MNLTEYQTLAARTMNPDWDVEGYGHGVSSETGELSDVVKKMVFHEHLDPKTGTIEPKTINNFLTELGDSWWYLAAITSYFGWDLGEICDFPPAQALPEMRLAKWARETNAEALALCDRAVTFEESHPALKDPALVRQKIYLVGWRLFILGEAVGLPYTKALPINIERLKKRYPQGFNTTDSINNRPSR